MRTPLFSIIIPTLNEEKFLPKLLASLENQSKKNFEVIVVDGSSKDKTVIVAKSFSRKFPKLIVLSAPEANVSLQRNAGAARASGSWLLFIDADSILLPYALERIEHFTKKEKPVMFTTWFRPDSEVPSEALVTLFLTMMFEAAPLIKRSFTQGTFCAVRKDAFELVGGYDGSIAFGEDYDLTKRICQRGVKLQVLRETLYEYSLRRYRYHGTLQTMQAGAKAVLSVLLINKTPRALAGYIMGGHVYGKKKRIKRSVLKMYERKLKVLMKELFA